MHTDPETRTTGRIRPRLLAAIALASALAIGVSGCTLDTANQTKKVAGAGEPAGGDAEVPALAGTIEPIDSLVLAAPKPAKLNAAQAAAEKLSTGQEKSKKRRIHLTVASPEIALSRFGYTQTGQQVDCASPLDRLPKLIWEVAAGGTAESCVEAGPNSDIAQELTFTLPGTTNLFWLYVSNPQSSYVESKLECAVIDPGTWKPVDAKASAYTCDLQWMQNGDKLNPMPRVRVTKKATTVVTDPVLAQKLLKENCNKNQPECNYTSTRQRVVTPKSSEWTLLDMYTNCGPDEEESAEHIWAEEKEFQGKYTFGAGASGGWGNPGKDAVALKIKAEYKHIWSVSQSYKVSVEQPVPHGTANLFYAIIAYLELQGDFTITTKDKVYLIKDTIFSMPLKENWTDPDGNVVDFMQTQSVGVSAACAEIDGGDNHHGPKLTARMQKQINSGTIPSADQLLAAGATLVSKK